MAYFYFGIPQGGGLVEWVVCERSPRFELVITELLNNDNYPRLSTIELQTLYMDRNRIESISPSVVGTIYQAAVQSLHNAHGTRMKVLQTKIEENLSAV